MNPLGSPDLQATLQDDEDYRHALPEGSGDPEGSGSVDFTNPPVFPTSGDSPGMLDLTVIGETFKIVYRGFPFLLCIFMLLYL